MSCDVCTGTGDYPVINRFGLELYAIICPECGGCGLSDEDVRAAQRAHSDRARYDAAMAETPALQPKGEAK